MRALKINFGGAGQVSLDWNAEVSGISGVAQRAGVAVMTSAGSDKFLPSRGTDVAFTLLSYGAFDFMSMQHTLNFGSLKARDDMRDFEVAGRPDTDRIANLRMTLLDVKNGMAEVGVDVTNRAGQATRQITAIT